MNDEDRKRLTIFSGMCWHEGIEKIGDQGVLRCEKCEEAFHPLSAHYTFATQADMMALYQGLHETGTWEKYFRFAQHRAGPILKNGSGILESNLFAAWLFCLSGEGYEERCQMVNDFLGGQS